MIKSNELRCGNLVWDNYGGIYKVVNINSEGFDYIDAVKPSFKAIGRHELESIEPIPLTEEWLKRFGFEEQEIQTKSDGTTEIGFVKDIMMVLKGNNFYYAAPYGYPNARITQVHQLQNLYFALTQTELTPSDGGKIE